MKRKNWFLGGLILIVGTGLLMPCCAGLGLLVYVARTRPVADREGESWTHEELLAYVNDKREGPRFVSAPSMIGTLFGPSAFWTDEATLANHASDFVPRQGNPVAAGLPVVYVQKLSSAQDARDMAATMLGSRDQNTIAFAWGRFLFCGHAETVERVKRTLIAG